MESIGCMHWVQAASPYRSEQIVVVFALLFGLLAWRRVRPRPSWLVAVYMAAASIVTMSVTFLHVSARTSKASETTAALILQASAALAVCICAVVVHTRWQRRQPLLAPALVLHTRRNSSE